MKGDVDVAAAARLLGEPARAELVLALMDRSALPAGELAARVGIAPSTASEHLSRLVEGNVLSASRKGRRRYYRLAGPEVAQAVEALAAIAPRPRARSLRDATRGELLRFARTCYDHLAGRAGVELARGLERERAVIRRNGTYVIGPSAGEQLAGLGIDIDDLRHRRRPLVRGCLDWSERDLHVAGVLGAALATRFFELGWIVRRAEGRSLEVTAAGRQCLQEFGVDLSRAGSLADLG